MNTRICDSCGLVGDNEMNSVFSAQDPVDKDEWEGVDNGSPEPLYQDWCERCYKDREDLLLDPWER